jgi:hypothetical protein
MSANGLNGEEQEQEYHTSTDSQASSDNDEEEDDIEDDGQRPPSAPLLPPELLRPLPSPAQSPVVIPYSQMTRKQKRAQRNHSRQAKKAVWEQLREGSGGTGVLEAGQVAQLKRGVGVSESDGQRKVRSGRVEKKKKLKPKFSGRQQLVEERKRAAAQKVLGPATKKKAKAKSKS